LLLDGPALPEYVDGWVAGLTQIKSSVSIKVFRMQLDLSALFYYLIHVDHCSGQYSGVLEVDVVALFSILLSHCRFVRLVQAMHVLYTLT
jgi:hypothetical protein